MPVGEQLYVLKEYWYKNPYPPYTGEVQDCALTLLMQGEASSAGTQPIAPVSIHCFIFLIVFYIPFMHWFSSWLSTAPYFALTPRIGSL
jgi:hypothetical protein